MSAPDGRDSRDAFEDLYQSTCDDLLRYLVRRCRDAEEAADLLAETYLTAWGKLDAVPDGEAARLWLFGVARNLLLRSARRRRVADALIDRLAEGMRAAQATPLAHDRRHHAVRVALADLSDQDQEIVTLTAWEGLAPARSHASWAPRRTSCAFAYTVHGRGSRSGSTSPTKRYPAPRSKQASNPGRIPRSPPWTVRHSHDGGATHFTASRSRLSSERPRDRDGRLPQRAVDGASISPRIVSERGM